MTEAFRASGRSILSGVAVVVTILGFTGSSAAQQKANEATDATKAANAALLKQLPFDDKTADRRQLLLPVSAHYSCRSRVSSSPFFYSTEGHRR